MTKEVTRLLDAMERGEPSAAEQLLPLVYDELRALAARRISRESAGQTLQATALVHEAYLRLVGPAEVETERHFEGRSHFLAAAADAMRRILVDRARARGTAKRGGGRVRLELDPDALFLDDVPAELLDLDEALDRLAGEDPVKARLVSLRFFGGLTLKEGAAALDISLATAERYWAYARAWLFDAMK